MYLPALLIIVFSGFYISSIKIDPIYIAFLLGVFFLYPNAMSNRRINLKSELVPVYAFIAYIVITQYLILKNYSKPVINVLLALIYFIVTFRSVDYMDYKKISRISHIFINTSIVILIIEATYRWFHPVDLIENISRGAYIYRYKISSFMYQDSNFVGIYIVVLFFYCIYLKKYFGEKYNVQLIFLFILCLLTISKASIVTMILFWIIFDLEISKIFKIILLLVLGATAGMWFLKMIIQDESLMARYALFYYAGKYFESASVFNKAIGVGFGNAKYYMNIGAHSIFIAFLVEAGIVGLVALLLVWVYIVKKTKGQALVVLLPFSLNALALSGHSITFLYCVLAIICALRNNAQKYHLTDTVNKRHHKKIVIKGYSWIKY